MAVLVKKIRDIKLVESFVEESLRAISFINNTHGHMRPFVAPELPYFSKLTDAEKKNVIENLKLFNEVCEHVIASGESITNSRVMLWSALKRLDYLFPSDLFDYITSDHLVEIYDFNNIQIFRNLQFFDVTSYSLEELLCRPWVEIFSRKDNLQIAKITEVLKKIFSKELSGVVSFKDIGINRIIETDSPFLLETDAIIHFVAPIMNASKQVAGYVAIESAELATAMPQGLEAEKLLLSYYDRMK